MALLLHVMTILLRTIEAERLDDGGRSRVELRVAGVLPFTVLKIFAFQERHENKDAYDLIFTLLNYDGGPKSAGGVAAVSPASDHEQVREALKLLENRFRDVDKDGPKAYGHFLAEGAVGDAAEETRRLRRGAVAVVGQFIRGFREGVAARAG